MKNTSATREVATKTATTTAKKSNCYDSKAPRPLSVTVCIGTAEKIDLLSQDHDQPPALIAGALANIGTELLASADAAEDAGTSFDELVMKILNKQFPRQRIKVPIVAEAYVTSNSKSWASKFNRPLEEWLSYMVELGMQFYQKPDLLGRLLPSAEEAYFLSLGHRIREDIDPEDAEIAVLLRTTPAPRSPFATFERALAQGGGEE